MLVGHTFSGLQYSSPSSKTRHALFIERITLKRLYIYSIPTSMCSTYRWTNVVDINGSKCFVEICDIWLPSIPLTNTKTMFV